VRVTIYHNPRCSKSRQALALLRDRGLEPVVIEYLKNPPDAGQLRDILARLGCGPRDLMRRNEPAYRENHLDDEHLGDDDLIAAMLRFPILMERPIVLAGAKAVIGRPPDRVLDII
jgi:arsenate reductase (glutaredoxin)